MDDPQSVQEALEELRQVTYKLDQLVAVRTRAIRSAHLAGASLRMIAEAGGLSKDRVRKILG
jgi:hypothetical protein